MSGSSQQLTLKKSGVRSAMGAASQLPRRGPTIVDDAPHLHVNQKSSHDMMIKLFRQRKATII